MIIGIVRSRAVRIRLTICRAGGSKREINALVDTGYTGWLSLPHELVSELGLKWDNIGCAELADGSLISFDVYSARIEWFNRVRKVFVDEFDSDPLVGMALLRGCEFKMQVRSRGKVTIKRLPS